MTAADLFPQAQFKDVKDSDLKAMDCQISELSSEVQTLTQSCRQLDAGLHCEDMFCVLHNPLDLIFHNT